MNDVEWQSKPDALVFHGNGLAYTDTLAYPDQTASSSGTTIFLVLDPAAQSYQRGMQFIVSLTNFDPATQFVIAQWRDHLIVMSGDNYDDSERRPRLDTRVAVDAVRFDFLAIRLTADSAELFVNGILTSHIRDAIRLPPVDDQVRVLFADSQHLKNSWSGRIAGFALFPQRLPDSELAAAWHKWSQQQRFRPATPEMATIYYDFAEPQEGTLLDLSGTGNRLLIPTYRLPLLPTLAGLRLELSSAWDMTENLFGFMPFGFLLAWVASTRWRSNISSVIAVVLACSAFLSGSIELSQAWIPSRTSSLMDLLLNVTGAVCGAIVHFYLQHRDRSGLKTQD